MRIVFLDIDGVLNSQDWWRRRYLARGTGGTDQRWRPIDDLDPEACARVQRLCEAAGAEIVVSSTWRILHKRPALREMFCSKGLEARIVGVTPRMPGRPRGEEIVDWLLRTAPRLGRIGKVDGIVILDDSSDAGAAGMSPWFVKTDSAIGFGEAALERATFVLRETPPPAFDEAGELR